MSIKRNTSYNILGAIIPLAVTIVTLPLFLRTIGEERYGVLAILWTLLGYFGLFDLGLGRAVTNRIAALRNAAPADREHVFWTALLLNFGLGIFGALALWGAGELLFAHFVRLPDGLTGEVEAALPWMVLGFPLLLVSSVFTGALSGREEFLHQNLVRVGEGVLIQTVPLVVALQLGPSLLELVLGVLAVRLLASVVLFIQCRARLPVGIMPRPRWSLAPSLFAYGGWITVTGIVGPLLSTFDRVLIGAFAGVQAVAQYTVPFSLVSRLSIIPGSLSSVLFPRFSAQSKEEDCRVLLRRATQALAAFLTPLVLLGVLGMKPFLMWWLGDDFASKAWGVGEVLLLGMWANCLAYVPFAMLQGRGRPDLVAKIHLVEVVPYVVLLWWMLPRWGAVGAAAAWSLRAAVDAAMLFKASRAETAAGPALVTPIFLLAVGAVLALGLPWQHPSRLAGGGAVLAAGVWWAWGHAPNELRRALSGRLRRCAPDSLARKEM